MTRFTLALMAWAAAGLLYRVTERQSIDAALTVALALALGLVAGLLVAALHIGGRKP